MPKSIKKYVTDESLSWEERYHQLEAHHKEETEYLLNQLKEVKTKVLEAVMGWVAIREANGQKISSAITFAADIHHSALLERLLNGKEALPNPPPKSFSYPWYELIENGEAEILFPGPHESEPFFKEKLNINQSLWDIVRKVSDTEWIVTHERTPGVNWRVWLNGQKELPSIKKEAIYVDD